MLRCRRVDVVMMLTTDGPASWAMVRKVEASSVPFSGELLVAGTLIEPNDAGGCLVPPLLLQPIVENAVVHGVAHALEGGTVRIEAACRGRHVMIVVENPCDPDRPRGRRRGVGLANVRGRLAALHPSEATVQTKEEGGIWRVELLLPAATAGGIP